MREQIIYGKFGVITSANALVRRNDVCSPGSIIIGNGEEELNDQYEINEAKQMCRSNQSMQNSD